MEDKKIKNKKINDSGKRALEFKIDCSEHEKCSHKKAENHNFLIG